MELKHLIYLILISSALMISSCKSSEERTYLKIKDYFHDKHDFEIGSDINKIVVIAEGKSCLNCEIAFAEVAYQYLKDSSVFLVTAKGNYVDISNFLKIDNRCFFDWQLNCYDFPEFESSRVIYLKESEVDTVIVINTDEIMQQLDFFKSTSGL